MAPAKKEDYEKIMKIEATSLKIASKSSLNKPEIAASSLKSASKSSLNKPVGQEPSEQIEIATKDTAVAPLPAQKVETTFEPVPVTTTPLPAPIQTKAESSEEEEEDDDEEEEEEEETESEETTEEEEQESDSSSSEDGDDEVKHVLEDLKKRQSISKLKKMKLDIPEKSENDNFPAGFRASSLAKSFKSGTFLYRRCKKIDFFRSWTSTSIPYS